jgi:hypothetical protein
VKRLCCRASETIASASILNILGELAQLKKSLPAMMGFAAMQHIREMASFLKVLERP